MLLLIAVIAGIVGIPTGLWFLVFKRHTVWRPEVTIRKEDCTGCNGHGEEALILSGNGKWGWGPIPKHFRRDRGGGDTIGTAVFQASQANVRDCVWCRGSGLRVIAEDDINIPPSTRWFRSGRSY